MAVAYDTFLRSLRTATTDPWTFTYTPVGTPRGILLGCYNIGSTTQHISSATYGGVDMGSTVYQGAFNGDALDMRFLGSAIPTGAQTVSLDLTSATTDDLEILVFSVTASADTEIVDSESIAATVDDPAMTALSYGGRTCIALAYGAINQAAVGDITENANMTALQEIDKGSYCMVAARQTTPGTSDFTVSWTTTSSSACLLYAAAISEIVGGAQKKMRWHIGGGSGGRGGANERPGIIG